MKITLEEMQAFIAVVDCGSVTAAAGQLGQTASGISRAIGRLEGKLGVTLLHRTTRRLSLSEEGQIFLLQARDVIQSVEAAEEQMALRREQPSGRLRINAASSFMQHVIVPLIPEFRRRYPQIMLELNTDDVFIDLLEQHTDVAIRIGALRDSSIHARLLGCTRLRVLASPDYLRRRGTPLRVEDLANHTLMGFTQSESLNLWPLRSEMGDYYPIQPAVAASNGEMLRLLALHGEGIARLSDFMTREDVAAGLLVQILPEDTLDVRLPVNAVYYRNTALAGRIVSFLDFLSEKIALHPL
ncbi:LysR family transcriptional regulator [Musicola paradisiaca]|uniref:Transcriptional regulator, LysR family n=1 Tax=Musicola paradisiaca (strain Ech703) TaxID=579405 RepID=C6C444_MUSP7|nr:LysR family transcriptional regulator [Musicola paradisiaca]ACS87371.1 transcriptional regulator, LysR family [Musicola paradisiaca Ech703]